MNQRRFRNIIAVIGVTILAGIVGYFIMNQPAALLQIELKYRLEEKFGKATFCGPPVVSSDYEDELLKQFPSASTIEEFTTILKHLNIANDGFWTDQEKLTIVREHNRLSVISLEPYSGKYKFNIRSQSPDDKGEFIFEGLITQAGAITTTKKEPYPYGCPICLAENTLIDTPSGLIAVQNLQEGEEVWTLNSFGLRIPAKIVKTIRVPAPTDHRVIHFVLDDSRELFVSPFHPTGDGRIIGELSVGDVFDGGRVLIAESVSYQKDFTYDILPSGETGLYWANSILVGSTLSH